MTEQKVTAPIRWGLGTTKQLSPVWKGYAVTPQREDEEHMARIVLIDKNGFQRIGYPLEQTTPDGLLTTCGCSRRNDGVRRYGVRERPLVRTSVACTSVLPRRRYPTPQVGIPNDDVLHQSRVRRPDHGPPCQPRRQRPRVAVARSPRPRAFRSRTSSISCSDCGGPSSSRAAAARTAATRSRARLRPSRWPRWWRRSRATSPRSSASRGRRRAARMQPRGAARTTSVPPRSSGPACRARSSARSEEITLDELVEPRRGRKRPHELGDPEPARPHRGQGDPPRRRTSRSRRARPTR